MKRRAWNIFCLLSLLVFATSVTLWVRSCFVKDLFGHSSNPLKSAVLYYGLACSNGAIRIHRVRLDIGPPETWGQGWVHQSAQPEPIPYEPRATSDRMNIQILGFEAVDKSERLPSQFLSRQFLILPLWLFLPAGIPPLIWWRKWRKRGARGFPVGVASGANNVNQVMESNDAQRAQRHKDHGEESI